MRPDAPHLRAGSLALRIAFLAAACAGFLCSRAGAQTAWVSVDQSYALQGSNVNVTVYVDCPPSLFEAWANYNAPDGTSGIIWSTFINYYGSTPWYTTGAFMLAEAGTYWFDAWGYTGDVSSGGTGQVVSGGYASTYSEPTAVTFTVSPTSFTYNGSSQGPTVTASPSNATYSVSGTASATNAGTYSLTATATGSYSGSQSASWTINPAGLSAAAIQPVVYTGSPVQPSAVSSVTPAGAPVTVSSTSAHTAVGTYADGLVSLAAGGNYNAGTLTGLSWSITGVPITAATIQAVANNGQPQQPSAVASVTPAGATVSVSSSSGHTAAGTYTDGIVTGTGNYSGTLTGLSWTITAQTQAAVTISPTSANVAFGQAAALTAAGGSGTGSYDFTNNSPVSGATVNATSDTVTFDNVGTDSVSLSKAGDSNYAPSGTATATVTVAKATPVLQSGSFPGGTISTATALTGAMLNAVFANPYSSAVAAPTGTVTYAVSGIGAITPGMTLPEGIYQIVASYPGDGNYSAAIATATFTVMDYIATNTYSFDGGGTAGFTLPSGANYVEIRAWGAGGGEGVGSPGAGGGYAMAGATLNSGQTLTVLVGGAGSGFQGGGGPGGGTAAGLGGAGGGGYTRVWGGAVNVWAGGGGGGGNSWSSWGGGGGGPDGQTGFGPGSYGGGGGTQTAGGAGGSGDIGNGQAGAAGQGGNSEVNNDYVGGGGGGGYYGGGGGGTGDTGCGGGGGGSSYIATNTNVQAFSGAFEDTPGGTSDPEYPGNNIGYGAFGGTYSSGYNGYVVIDSYQMPSYPAFANVPSSGSPATFGNLQSYSYQVQATGTPAVASYAVASGSSLPPGLSLNTSTGLITGTCSTAGTSNQYYSTGITATNSVGSTTVTYYWEVLAPVLPCTTAGFANPTPLAGAADTFNYTVGSNFGVYWAQATLWPPPGSTASPLVLPNTYAGGPPFPGSFSGSYSFTSPAQPGVYSMQLRVVDIYQNYQDYWFIFQVDPETDPLPYSTSFETSGNPSWAYGQLNVENGWMCWEGGAYVVSSGSGYPVEDGSASLEVLGSTQYATLDGGIPIAVELVKAFNTNNGAYAGAYLDVYAMPVATASVLNSSIIDNTDSEIGFQLVNSGVATVMVLDGNGTGGGTWTDTGIHFAVDATGKSTSWLRITAYNNYADHTWNLWVNGAYYGPGAETPQAMGMVNDVNSSLTELTWYGADNTSYMDNLNVQTANPFPTPAAPVISSVSSPGAGEVTISWTAPSDPYGIGYYQVQSAAGSGGYTLAGTSTTTSLTLTGLTVGTSYSFQVQAENLSGNWSPWSAAYTATLASLQLNTNPTLTFTYNGSAQGPDLSVSDFTITPSSAGASITGTTSAVNAGSYAITVTPTGPNIIGEPWVVNWTIARATPTLALSPTVATVAVGDSVTFTASGDAGGGYTWWVSPLGPTGISGAGGSQTITFPAVNLAGSPPQPSPYTVSVYSDATTNYNLSATLSASVSVTAPTTTDNANSTVQLNLHAPAH